MIFDLDRRAEDGEKPVAAIGDERAAVLENRVARLVEVAVQRGDDELRRPSLSERGEATQVGEHDRADRSDAPEAEIVVGPGEDVLDDVLGKESREDVVNARTLEVVEPLLRQPGVDARTKEGRVEGLRQVVVGTDLDAANDAVDLVDCRDHDHGDVLGARRRLELLERRDPIELRHEDVEQDDIGRLLGEELERFATVRCGTNCVAFVLEQAPEQLPADVVVVRDQDRSRHRPMILSVAKPSVNL